MTSSRLLLLVSVAGAAAALASCSKPATEATPGVSESAEASASAGANDPIASAESAAPAAVAKAASIVAVQPDGSMKELRKGTNGFTCMPDNPTTPGPDPMCMDGNAMTWAQAWMGHKPPPTDKAGIMYMLSGGTDASNTDPYAKQPTSGGDWIHTGPHIMVVGSKATLAGYPSGPNPNTKAPYVMWAGTPYAHLMIPVS
ncbi:MAG: hypothetical protein JF593_02605 [Novosphingobium sp.]|nr:hypothetical protein [Novosphingobium sp.]